MQTAARMRLLVLCVVGWSAVAIAEDEIDAGVVAENAAVAVNDAGVAPVATPEPKVVAPPPEAPPTFDLVQSPWGPGRKSSGEKFASTVDALPDGAFRLKGEKWSLGFGGQYFARGEVRDNADFSAAAGDHSLGIDHRARLSVRASAFERVGVLLELQDVRGWGSERNTVTTEPFTGLHQGFVDVRVMNGLDVRVGRQELSYGEDRLIGNLDWAQSARAFDGVFVRAKPGETFTIDAFAMMLRAPSWQTAAGARFHNSGQFFYGAYTRARPSKTFGFDVYLLGLHDDPAALANVPQRDLNLATLGARAFWNPGALQLVGEGAFQLGQAQAAQVLAGAFAARATYVLPVPHGFYVGAEVLGATGDGDPTDATNSTFNQLFPTGHLHLGYMDYVGWQNVVGFKGSIGLKPAGMHFWVDVHHFRAWDPRGAWYSASGAVILGTDASRTNANMGTELDFNATVPVTKNVAIAGAFGVFLVGGEASARGVDASTWGFLSVRTQF